MLGLTLSNDVKIGDLSILISAAIFIYTLYDGWRLRRREYADKIRKAAGTVISKLERWRELTLRFFQDIQPLITKIDMELVKDKDFIKVRDNLWMGITEARAVASQRITDEMIEMAYVDLYGYDPRIQNLYTAAINELKLIEAEVHREFLTLTQEDVLIIKKRTSTIKSGMLGNKLHGTSELVSSDCINLMNEAISIFRNEMIKLTEASDGSIVNRDINFEERTFPFSTMFYATKGQSTQDLPEMIDLSIQED
jgi:hypothetical protein